MKNNMNRNGVLILIGIFLIFYLITTFFLDRRNINKNTPVKEEPTVSESDYRNEEAIVEGLYEDVRMLYDVVNNKYSVSQDDVITIGDIIYKRITNFDDVTKSVFTENGRKKYLTDLNNYFAITEDGYYLAGNLVSYQTYYFRGDDTNIYILDASDGEINGIIYARWTTNYKNTLATIKVVMESGNWLIDNIDILATE